MTREELEIVINDTTLSQDTRDDAKSQLAKLDALQTSSGVEGINNDILFAVREFNQSIDKLAKAGVDKKQVEDIVDDKFRDTKIGKNNLDSTVLELIGKTQTVQIINWQNVVVKTGDGKKRKIFDLMLSDFEAGNNIYLYGGAGTGKTFIAKEVANALNYKLITLNCNQFTSPLDIVGGQTIEGYQEGRLIDAFGYTDARKEMNKRTGK
jgi:Holliday junction resolvasome RuvABC ATP-dependent DNA helicase subunit